MKKLKILILIPLLFTLTACMPKNTEIKYRLVIEGIGVDYDKENNLYDVTVQVLETQQGEEAQSSQSKTYTVKGETLASAITSLVNATGKYPLYSQNRLIILGSSLTGDRMIQALNFFVREYTSRPDVFVASASGKASDVLNVQSAGESTAKLIESAIEQSHEASVSVDTELFNTVNLSLEETTSFLLPLIEVTDEYGKDKCIKVTGSTAFSNEEKNVALSSEETFFCLLTTNKAKTGTFNVTSDDIRTALEIMKTSSKIDVTYENGVPVFTVNVKCTVDITEFDSKKFTDLNAESVKKIESAAKEYLESGIGALCERFLKNEKCDIFRFGRRLLKKYPALYDNLKEQWADTMPKIQVKASAEVKVGRIGQMTIVERS